MKKLNNKKGISLIVLVITIAVMIILAAAIILSLQSSGIIGRANEAKSKTDTANAKQVVAMANAEWQLDEEKIRKEDSSIQSFKDYANKKLIEAGYATSGNGGISLSESGAINTIYVDSKNKQAIIPEGFAVSTVASEKTIEDGLVIKDENDNEFVWVPVEVEEGKNFEEVFKRNSLDNGDIEPITEACSNFDYDTSDCIDIMNLSSTNDLTGEWKEETAMRESVEKQGGFYIARYEAGKGENNVVVSKKGATVWNNIAWGINMIEIGEEGAVYYSRLMYKNSNSVVSTLCYGVQWDAVMNFMDGVPNIQDKNKYYIEDSTGMGHYAYDSEGNLVVSEDEAEVQPTGYYSVKNIYDMAGNVQEWTMESSVTYHRVLRGGFYTGDGLCLPANSRFTAFPEDNYEDMGFRVALYIK